MRKIVILLSLIIILITGIIGVFGNTIYSGADEAAHYDYINYIIENRKLPVLDDMINSEQLNINEAKPDTIPVQKQHEAVQPPLYYLIAAFLGGFIKNLYIRLIFLRILGVLSLLLSFCITIKIYQLMVDRNHIIKNDGLFIVIAMSIIISPYFQRIMVPLNNEHLLLILVTLLVYKLINYSGKDDINVKQSVIVGVIVGAAILTKITACYLVLIVVIAFIIKKWYRQLLITGSTSLITILPWILFNLRQYNALTGTKKHIEIVLPIVNPTNYHYTFIDIIKELPNFFTSIWFWRGVYPVEYILNNFLSVIFVIAIIYSVIKFKDDMNYIFVFCVVGNICLLVAITLLTPIASIVGRYMYMNYVSSVVILYIFISNIIDKRYHYGVTWLFGLTGILFTVSHLINLINK